MRAVRLAVVSMLMFALIPVQQASACMTCDPFLHCAESTLGARFCVMTGLSCSLLIPCSGAPSRETDRPVGDSGVDDLTTFTLFDAAPGNRVQPTRRAGALPLALGEDMRASAGVGAAAIAEAGVAHGREFAGAFVDESGEGFALRRVVEGAQIRLEVREMRGDRAGAVLASELLAEGDQLTVPVRLEGRDRVLVLSTRTVPKVLARIDLSRLQRSVRAVGRANALRTQPLFKVHAL